MLGACPPPSPPRAPRRVPLPALGLLLRVLLPLTPRAHHRHPSQPPPLLLPARPPARRKKAASLPRGFGLICLTHTRRFPPSPPMP